MENDLVGLTTRRTLEADAHPTMGLVERLVGAGRHRISKGEERPLGSAFLVEALHEQGVLVIEHLAESLATHEARALAVDGIREGHIVGRDCLGDCSCSTTHMEKPACHLLTCPDLGEGPVDGLGHVDLEGLLIHLQLELIDHRKLVLRSRTHLA